MTRNYCRRHRKPGLRATFEQTYSRGKATSKLKVAGPGRGTGTSITFEPDPEIFGAKLSFDAKLIRDRMEAKSYLHKGMKVVFKDETAEPPTEETFQHEGGIAEYIQKVVAERGDGARECLPAGIVVLRSHI